ncbi:porin family protein [Proteiniphilum sp. X52]|uniref:porin family protein n=1 Tax=Proteiniphilum sp. X52 TaxID=2382159 RepID=UPI000F09C932|nr:porin family protein [Proteiniphilum sp. X52]RNC66801.1 PorT family protein [Proteiniphilum sp. X52]
MKKIVLALAMVAMVGAVSAQGLSLGIKGGVNMSNLSGKEVKDSKMKLGFNVGMAVDYEFESNMAIQSGLYFIKKGAKLSSIKIDQKVGEIQLSGTVDKTVNAMYLQVPLHLAYKIDVSPEARLVLHAGPYAAYGIGGKISGKSTVKAPGNVPADKKAAVEAALKEINASTTGVKTFDKKMGYKPFDAGVGIGLGAEFGSFLVDLGWDMGLLNISRNKGVNVKNQNAYLSVGFKF